jgi:hypothetical protein
VPLSPIAPTGDRTGHDIMALITKQYHAPADDLVIAVTLNQELRSFHQIEVYRVGDPSPHYLLPSSNKHLTSTRLQHSFASGFRIDGSLTCEPADANGQVQIRANLRYGQGAEANYTQLRQENILQFPTHDAPPDPPACDDPANPALPAEVPPAPQPGGPDTTAQPAPAPQEALFPYVYLRKWPQADTDAIVRDFAQFPPSSAGAPLYTALTATPPLTREQMQTEALLFRSGGAPFAGLYVPDCTKLLGLVQLLPKVADAARIHGCNPAALVAAILALFNVKRQDMAACLQSPDYQGAIDRVWQSYFANLILAAADDQVALLDDYTRLLLTDHLLQVLFVGATGEATAADLAALRAAVVLLPKALFPLPPATPTGPPQMSACAIGELQMVRQTLLRYEAGELARVENIMPGERRETRRTQARGQHLQHSDSDSSESTLQAHAGDIRHSLAKQAEQSIAEQTVQNKYTDFDTSYGPPTQAKMNGSWTEWTKQGSSPGSEEQTAFARDIVRQSVTRVARSVGQARAHGSYAHDEDSATSIVDNSASQASLLCAFRWLNKVYQASVVSHGQRLMVEFMLAQPAAGLRARAGFDDGAGAMPVTLARSGVASFTDVTPKNYASLAAAYQVTALAPPPAATRMLSATLCNGEQKLLPLPAGYYVSDVDIIYQADNPDADSPVVLVGREKFKPGDDPKQVRTFGEEDALAICVLGNAKAAPAPPSPAAPSGSTPPPAPTPVVLPLPVPGAPMDVLLNVVVQCKAGDALLDAWRIQTYDALLRGYRELAAQARSEPRQRAPEARAQMRKQVRQGCTRMLLARAAALLGPPDQDAGPDAGTMADPWLLQFIGEVFEWQKMCIRLFASPNEVPLAGDPHEDLAFAEFLDADLAQVLLPVTPQFETELLYFLSSGQRWEGGPALAPVDYANIALVQELNRLRAQQRPLPVGQAWEVVVPTAMQVQDQHFSAAPAPAGGA